MRTALLLLTITVVLSTNILAQNGSLDPTFGVNGIVSTDLGSDTDEGKSIAIQADGKIVVVGNIFVGVDGLNQNFDLALARYNADGTLDITFSGDGKVTTDISNNSFDVASAVVVQSDGKILVVGSSASSNGFALILVRYNANGSLDNTFDADGIVFTSPTNSVAHAGYSVALQTDGKIIVAGARMDDNLTNDNGADFFLARYNTDGTPDLSFGTSGSVTTDFYNTFDFARSIHIQSDGKILVVGSAIYNAPSYMEMVLARYNADGSLDNTFDTDGKVRSSFDSQVQGVSLVQQADSKVIIAGTGVDDWELTTLYMIRYNSDGTIDNTFGTAGVATSSAINAAHVSLYNAVPYCSMLLQHDGKIAVAGSTAGPTGYAHILLLRFNTDGSADMSFGQNGKLTTDLGSNSGNSWGTSIAWQADEKILVAGYTDAITFLEDFALVRYDVSSAVTGDEEILSSEQLNIYPNPSNGNFTIETPVLESGRVGVLKISDALGNVVHQLEIQEVISRIDLTGVLSGVYFLTLETGGGFLCRKVVIR